MRLIFIIFFLIGLSQAGSSQYATYKETLKRAIDSEIAEDYYAAYHYYTQLIGFDRDPERYHYKAALNAMKLKAYITADEHFQHLDTLELEEPFTDLNYYRAVAAHNTGRYDSSLVYYKLYVSEEGADSVKLEEAEDMIESVVTLGYEAEIPIDETTREALSQREDTLVEIKHLGESVNSPYGEFGTAMLSDERFLFPTDRALIMQDDYETRRKIAQSPIRTRT